MILKKMKVTIITILVAVLVATTIYGAGFSNKHDSDVFLAWKSGTYTGTMFLANTFGGNFNDPCRVVKTRKDYIQILEDNGIRCNGTWCDPDGGFACKSGPKNCYNMEHIVDLKNSMFDDLGEKPKMILGNLIMAYGRWNIEMGPLLWENVEREKRAVYGDDVVDQAIDNIQKCYDDKHSESVVLTIFGIVFIVLLVLTIFGLVTFCMYKKCYTDGSSKDDNSYVEMSVLETKTANKLDLEKQ